MKTGRPKGLRVATCVCGWRVTGKGKTALCTCGKRVSLEKKAFRLPRDPKKAHKP